MIRKIKNGAPKKAGTIIGLKVEIQSRLLNMTYCGMIVTSPGSIMVIIMQPNQKPLKRKGIRAKA
ncbi:hypothetical protein D3C71_2133950 [compost metagenome]